MTIHRPSFLLIAAITVTGITANTLITPSIPNILAGLGVSDSLAGVLVGAGTLPGIALAPVIGLLADRYGRREVIVPCMVLFGVAGGLGAVAPNFWSLVGLRLLQGAGSAGLINLAIVIIGDHWEGDERARLIGRNAAVLTVCLAVFPLLGGALTDAAGWRTPFLVYPVALVTAVALWRRLPTAERVDATIRRQILDSLPYLRDPRIVGTLAATLVVFVVIFGLILTVLPVYLESEFGVGATARGLVLGVPALGATLASSNLGRMTARLGRRRVLAIASLLWLAAGLVVAMAPSVLVIVVGTSLFGLGEGTLVPSFQDIAAGSAPASSRGAVVAVLVSAARTGQTVGPVGASGLAGVTSPSWTFVAGALTSVLVLGPLARRATAEPVAQEPASA